MTELRVMKSYFFSKKLVDKDTKYSLNVFSKSKTGKFISKISKALNLSIDIQSGSENFCVTKANLSEFLKKKITNNLSHFDKKNVLKAVKSEINRIKNTKKNPLNIDRLQCLIEKKISIKLWKKFSERLLACSDSKERGFNRSLINNLQTKSISNPSTESLIQEFIDLEEKSKKPDQYLRLLYRIHRNRNNISPAIVHFADEISNRFAKLSLIKQNEPVVSTASTPERKATLRTPNEVIMDLLSFLKDHPEKKYQEIEVQAKSLFMTHTATIANTRKFLQKIKADFHNDPIFQKCVELDMQLTKEEIMTRFHDNIYGRAFDSAFVSELVKAPPEEVCNSMTALSQGLAKYLKDEVMSLSQKKRNTILKKIGRLLQVQDPRFWFPLVPEIKELQVDEGRALEGLIRYLEKPKQSGHECISIPYLLVKVSLILRGMRLSPPWLREADAAYSSTLSPMVRLIRTSRKSSTPMNTPGGGITLHYQPSIVLEEGMEESQRPTTVRKPRYGSKGARDSAKEALEKSLRHGLPWSSGMSGSTNISLYAMNYFNKNNKANIDPKATLLGIIMFLVYDGGHSIHEPLWAATLVNQRLKLGYEELGGTKRVQDFVSDYEKFTNMYSGNLRNAVSEAFDRSFERTLDYFKENSRFAQRPPQTEP